MVSEEKIFLKVYRRTTDDERQVMAIAHTDELIILKNICNIKIKDFYSVSKKSIIDKYSPHVTSCEVNIRVIALILSRAAYHIARACECNMIYCEGQYSSILMQ